MIEPCACLFASNLSVPGPATFLTRRVLGRKNNSVQRLPGSFLSSPCRASVHHLSTSSPTNTAQPQSHLFTSILSILDPETSFGPKKSIRSKSKNSIKQLPGSCPASPCRALVHNLSTSIPPSTAQSPSHLFASTLSILGPETFLGPKEINPSNI
jgi:hypothetical protein